MNTYQIARSRTKIAMDAGLLRDFESLRSLGWKPLTANLESCEDGPFLYFRITLRLSGGTNTFAGFPSGAPFMLARDSDVKKKGFFLRHWVRKDEDNGETHPLFESQHLHLAIVNESMIVRVNIDREMTLHDTFKSVPFATWMFQVVQVDAVIEGAPGIRFAFAIERTVTPEERITIQGNVEHSKNQTKIQKAAAKTNGVRVAPVRVPPQQATADNGKTSTITSTTPGVDSTGSQPVARQLTVANPGGILARALNPRNAVSMPAAPSVAQAGNPPSLPANPVGRPRTVGRPIEANRMIPSGQTNSYNMTQAHPERKVYHPYLRYWEHRPLDDPYEPFFIVGSNESSKKIAKTWQIEDTSFLSLNFDYRRLRCLPGSDFPEFFDESLNASNRLSNTDDLIVMHPLKKARKNDVHVDNVSEGPDATTKDSNSNPASNGELKVVPGTGSRENAAMKKAHAKSEEKGDVGDTNDVPLDVYISVVKAAAEFNSNLESERVELSSWLTDDKRVEEEAAEASKEEGEESSLSD